MAAHVVLLHPALSFSGLCERTLATARVLRDAGHRVTLIARPGTRTAAFEEAGFERTDLELPLEPWRNPIATWRFRKALLRLRPDVVHATTDELVPLVSTVLPSTGLPWIVELHRPAEGPLLAGQRGLVCAIASSESAVASIVNHGGIPRPQVRVVKNAPAPIELPEPSTPTEDSGSDTKREPVIGCSGRLDETHATAWFLEAARLLVVGGERARFAILGEGPAEARIRRWIREHGLAERVTVAVPTTSEAAATLAALDVHVSCKLEGGPGWLACSAMAQAVPSVFAAAGDAWDLVEDRRSGVLVEPDNPRRLADELALLLANPSAARTAGLHARARLAEVAPHARFATEITDTVPHTR